MQKEIFKILLIDDEKINLFMLQELLQKEGYTVFTALKGSEGIEIARQLRPNLILLDVMMPEENGFEVCSRLKQDPETASIPIVFITALADSQNKIKGLEAGGLDYISKPFEKEEVFIRVKNILSLNCSFQRVIADQASRLRQVRDAQQALLVHPEKVPLARFGVYFKPLLDAGGDFFDVFEVGENIWDYFVADISGHDLAASYTISALKALVRYNSSQVTTIEESMNIINRVLQSLLQPDQHITSIYVRLNRNSGKMNVVNAANPPLLIIQSNTDPVWINGNSDALGAFENALFTSQEFNLPPDARFFMYSDGVIENLPHGNGCREKGLDCLYRACSSTYNYPLPEALNEIVKTLVPDHRKAEDDILLLGVDV